MSRSNRGEKNHFSMLKWRTINYKMKAPPGSTRTPAKLYWKADGKARRRGEKKRDWEKDRFIREYIVYVLCVAYPPWVLDWIGSPRQQYKHSKPRCGSASPPSLFQTEITLSRLTPRSPTPPPGYPYFPSRYDFFSPSCTGQIRPSFGAWLLEIIGEKGSKGDRDGNW